VAGGGLPRLLMAEPQPAPEAADGPTLMGIRYVRSAQTTHPTGDPSFAVEQSMPSAVPERECDPFLMCDEFGPTPSKGAHGNDTDAGFDVPWHPHHGMDILSYIVEGCGRHADSMGNRETFESPGFQWMSVGSGIEHAEGGGTPKGQRTHGFQIWLRMPTAKMSDAPRYGTVGPAEIPTVHLGADGSEGLVRVIAGPLGGQVGPAQFAVAVQILDLELSAGAEWRYTCPAGMDNVMFYAFKGGGTLNGEPGTALDKQHICRFDTGKGQDAVVRAGPQGLRMMVFTGKQTKEKLIWCAHDHGLPVGLGETSLGRGARSQGEWSPLVGMVVAQARPLRVLLEAAAAAVLPPVPNGQLPTRASRLRLQERLEDPEEVRDNAASDGDGGLCATERIYYYGIRLLGEATSAGDSEPLCNRATENSLRSAAATTGTLVHYSLTQRGTWAKGFLPGSSLGPLPWRKPSSSAGSSRAPSISARIRPSSITSMSPMKTRSTLRSCVTGSHMPSVFMRDASLARRW
jgi:redox-sensitive bicupin YhaK (pirin superfamily)